MFALVAATIWFLHSLGWVSDGTGVEVWIEFGLAFLGLHLAGLDPYPVGRIVRMRRKR